MTWDEVVAFGMTLPDAELSTSYGQPALKVGGRMFAATGRAPAEAFVLALPTDAVAMLVTTDPEIFYQTAHYVGWPAVLVRYAGDRETTMFWIARAHGEQAGKPKKKPRS